MTCAIISEARWGIKQTGHREYSAGQMPRPIFSAITREGGICYSPPFTFKARLWGWSFKYPSAFFLSSLPPSLLESLHYQLNYFVKIAVRHDCCLWGGGLGRLGMPPHPLSPPHIWNCKDPDRLTVLRAPLVRGRAGLRKVICLFTSRPPSPPLVPTVLAKVSFFPTLPARPRNQLGARVDSLHCLFTAPELISVRAGCLAGAFARNSRYSRLYCTGLRFNHSLSCLVLLDHLLLRRYRPFVQLFKAPMLPFNSSKDFSKGL